MTRHARAACALATLVVAIAACGGSSEPTTTTAPEPLAGAAAVTACTDAMNEAWEEISAALDPAAALDDALESAPLDDVCAFLTGDEPPPADEFGFTEEQILDQMDRELDPAILDAISQEVTENFEDVGESLD
jgi:hypothetical protein